MGWWFACVNQPSNTIDKDSFSFHRASLQAQYFSVIEWWDTDEHGAKINPWISQINMLRVGRFVCSQVTFNSPWKAIELIQSYTGHTILNTSSDSLQYIYQKQTFVLLILLTTHLHDGSWANNWLDYLSIAQLQQFGNRSLSETLLMNRKFSAVT